MISLRHKLWLGFGGLFLVLLLVSALSVVVLTRYSQILERVLRENYDSAVYCDAMKDSLDRLNALAQRRIWEGPGAQSADVTAQKNRFEINLGRQFTNCTLPGELDETRQLGNLWNQFSASYNQFSSATSNLADLYRRQLLPQFNDMMQVAQNLSDRNMGNMVSVDGEAKRTLMEVRSTLLVLVIAATVISALVIGTASAAILTPLRALTRSARQIQSGDLDLNLHAASNDEIGQLAEAFDSMAARLREFRQLDHERLVRTQQTTQLAIDSLPDAVFVIGPDEKVEISNRTARAHFGIEPGLTVSELRLKWLTPLTDSIKLDRKAIEPQGYTAAIQMFENGEERFLLPRAVPMLKENGELLGVAVILVDVTRLRRADEAKSGLISTVSHELRTPLTAVRMCLSLLANDKLGVIAPKQRQLVTAAREDSDRLYRIIDNLLQMSRIEAGRAQFQFRPMGASEIVAGALDSQRPAFMEKKLRVSISISEPSPKVVADPGTINSALGNLLSNALKFTPSGGEVRVSVEPEEEMVRFSVADSGPGIAQNYQSRIFEKFFRVPTASGPSGAGLGLSIVKEIVEAHGGRVGFHCGVEGGSTFYFTLPGAAA
jgi:signal transduction histidine kinase/HAMP domain-containing protein